MNRCCNTCLEVKEAYRKKNWHFAPSRFSQCQTEADSNSSVFKEGCQLYGTMEVNRVDEKYSVKISFYGPRFVIYIA